MTSVVPYNRDNSSVVLRHENRLVVYDGQSRQLVLRSTPAVPARIHRDPSPAAHVAPLSSPDCPYCHRPSACPYCQQPILGGDDDDGVSPRGGEPAEADEQHPEFINPEYFRLLRSSTEPSSSAIGHQSPLIPGSPRRRIPSLEGSQGRSSGPPTGRSYSGSGASSPPHGQGISSSAFSPNYFERFFVTERELGRGGKGVVLLVRHVLDGVMLGHFACKRVPIGDNHEWLEKVLLEVQLLQQLSHQNLVSYRHVWLENVVLTQFGSGVPVPCAFILQQYCNAGDLHNYIYHKKKRKVTNEDLKDQMRMRRMSKGQIPAADDGPRVLPFEQIISFFRDIASGLNHLHSNGFIHRDLKPSNCLLSDMGMPGGELRVLVSDFGEVQMENTVRSSTGATGTISYCAPEVLQRVAPDGAFGNFTNKSDIFSLGMILYFMCFGKLPYVSADQENEENEDLDDLRAEISAWAGFDDATRMRQDLPDGLYKSLKHLLSKDPNKRPQASDILLGMSGFNYREDQPLRGTLSPKPPKPTNIATDETSFSSRISPVADSGPVTPTSSPAPSVSSRGKTAVGSSSANGHKRHHHPNHHHHHHKKQKSTVPSKLRDIFQIKQRPAEMITDNEYNSGHSADISGCSEEEIVDEHVKREDRVLDDEEEEIRGRGYNAGSMILRPRNGQHEHKSLIVPPPAMSPPALMSPPPVPIQRRSTFTGNPEAWFFLRVLVFLGKIISMTSPCNPLAANPVVFYSLLVLALADLIGPFFLTSAILLGIHLAAVLMLNSWKMLCVPSDFQEF